MTDFIISPGPESPKPYCTIPPLIHSHPPFLLPYTSPSTYHPGGEILEMSRHMHLEVPVRQDGGARESEWSLNGDPELRGSCS